MTLHDWQIQDLLTEQDPDTKVLKWPVRAVRWAWFTIPKRVRTDDGYKRVTTVGDDVFHWLKQHREEYFDFLKQYGIEKSVYDKFIGKAEPKPRTTW